MKLNSFLAAAAAAIVFSGAARADPARMTLERALNLLNALSTLDQPYAALDKDGKSYQARRKWGKDEGDRERVQWAFAVDLDRLRSAATLAQQRSQDDAQRAQLDAAQADVAIAAAPCPADGDRASPPNVACAEARLEKAKILAADQRAGQCLMRQVLTLDLIPIRKEDLRLRDNDLSAAALSALQAFDDPPAPDAASCPK